MNRAVVNVNNCKGDNEFNFPRKIKTNELYGDNQLNNNMNSRIKLEKSKDKQSGDRTPSDLLSANINIANSDKNELKVNINSNGILNNSFFKNKIVKTVEANGSPMNFTKTSDNKQGNNSYQPRLTEDHHNLFSGKEKSIATEVSAEKSVDIVILDKHVGFSQNLNISHAVNGKNTMGIGYKQTSIENFGSVNGNTIPGKSVNISTSSFKTNQPLFNNLFKSKDSFLKK